MQCMYDLIHVSQKLERHNLLVPRGSPASQLLERKIVFNFIVTLQVETAAEKFFRVGHVAGQCLGDSLGLESFDLLLFLLFCSGGWVRLRVVRASMS